MSGVGHCIHQRFCYWYIISVNICILQILQTGNEDVLSVASSTICNLLLEFSPSKEPILDAGAVDLLVGLTKKDDPNLRLNGIWALMVSDTLHPVNLVIMKKYSYMTSDWLKDGCWLENNNAHSVK